MLTHQQMARGTKTHPRKETSWYFVEEEVEKKRNTSAHSGLHDFVLRRGVEREKGGSQWENERPKIKGNAKQPMRGLASADGRRSLRQVETPQSYVRRLDVQLLIAGAQKGRSLRLKE